MEYNRAGIARPRLADIVPRLEMSLGSRRDIMWVVPRDVAPFSMATWYPPRDALYGADFQSDFAAQFESLRHSRFFDLYTRRESLASRR
jgi:hypothetical protein